MPKQPRPTPEQRFWSHVEIGPVCPWLGSECWVWTARKDPNGYGRLDVGGRPALAHRFSFELAWGWLCGPWLSELQVDHVCLVPACVNSLHLRLATNKQNSENLLGAYRNSTSGIRGVCLNKRTGRFVARVMHNCKVVHVGTFDTVAEAEAAVIAKRLELFTYNEIDHLEWRAA